MNRLWKRVLAVTLSLLVVVQGSEGGVVFAANSLGQALHPTDQIQLTVPEKYQDGGSYFFIAQADYTASEKSKEKMYIPIQRTGDLDSSAQVTLKVTDVSARHDENYTIELYKDDTQPEIAYEDISIVDLAQTADLQEEVEPITDENEMGELIYESGGAQLLDKDGNVAGSVSVVPLDEEGNPIETEAEEPEVTPVSAEAPADEADSSDVSTGEEENASIDFQGGGI